MLSRIIRTLLPALLAMAVSLSASAQSSGDVFYNKGVAAMSTMTVASQNNAISYFQKAKKAYDSKSMKQKCDQQISLCRKNIQYIQGGGSKGGGSSTGGSKGGGSKGGGGTTVAQPKTELSLGNDSFAIESEGKTVEVTVTTNVSDWSVAAVPNSRGEAFATARKTGDNTFEIVVPANRTSDIRSQEVQVTARGEKRAVNVMQYGIPVVFLADKNSVEIKGKGGSATVDLISTHSGRYYDNSNYNWEVLQKPDWVEVVPEAVSNQDVSSIRKKAPHKMQGYYDSDFVKSKIKIIVVEKNTTGSTRIGDVILKSGGEVLTIKVLQKK